MRQLEGLFEEEICDHLALGNRRTRIEKMNKNKNYQFFLYKLHFSDHNDKLCHSCHFNDSLVHLIFGIFS